VAAAFDANSTEAGPGGDAVGQSEATSWGNLRGKELALVLLQSVRLKGPAIAPPSHRRGAGPLTFVRAGGRVCSGWHL